MDSICRQISRFDWGGRLTCYGYFHRLYDKNIASKLINCNVISKFC